jgi:hypothetical protein
MNPFLSMASDPYLTDPHQYAARHRRKDEDQALTDCIRLDYEAWRELSRPCNRYHGDHCTYTRRGERAA